MAMQQVSGTIGKLSAASLLPIHGCQNTTVYYLNVNLLLYLCAPYPTAGQSLRAHVRACRHGCLERLGSSLLPLVPVNSCQTLHHCSIWLPARFCISLPRTLLLGRACERAIACHPCPVLPPSDVDNDPGGDARS
eukprot:scpid97520/ scgid17485/ 